MKMTYTEAGVDIKAGNRFVSNIKECVRETFNANVLTDLGHFAALYDLKPLYDEYKHPVLVQSIDGLGTKPIIAKMCDNYDNLGEDLLSATANDILVLGAKPFSLLDYLASDKLDVDIATRLVKNLARACAREGVALVGGETAEMPGVYCKHEHDIVGVVTGVVDKEKIIDGHKIEDGHRVLGFASSGLHTNGYSLARKLFFEIAKLDPKQKPDGFSESLGDALLKAHLNYCRPVHAILNDNIDIKGMAHITGGGLIENIPRCLPENLDVHLYLDRWPLLPIFSLLKTLGEMDEKECYSTLNMGIGYIVIVDEKDVDKVKNVIEQFSALQIYEIGEVIKGNNKVNLIT